MKTKIKSFTLAAMRDHQRATTTSPTAQPSGGSGGGGCFLYSLEDLLNKNVSYTSIFFKITLKFTFLCKTPKEKNFLFFICLFIKEHFIQYLQKRHPDPSFPGRRRYYLSPRRVQGGEGVT
jgi:hypothetical protein